MESNYKIISSIDEISMVDVKYCHINYPDKFIEIVSEFTREGGVNYYIYGYVSGSNPTYITSNGHIAKSWKTFNGAKKYLKKCVIDGAWGMSKFR